MDWRNPKANAESFTDGWFHTGDIGIMDKDDHVSIEDRVKDMYISGGENVYPAEIEGLLYEMPQIVEVAVIGLKDEKWGETGCVCQRCLASIPWCEGAPSKNLQSGGNCDEVAKYSAVVKSSSAAATSTSAPLTQLNSALKQDIGYSCC